MTKTVDELMRLAGEFASAHAAWVIAGSANEEAKTAEAEDKANVALRSALEDVVANDRRYRFLRDLKCCTFSLRRDDDHAVNYTAAADWIDNCHAEWFENDPAEEVQRMRDTNTIWTLQVYPNTPIGFNVWNSATLDSVVDRAMQQAPEQEG